MINKKFKPAVAAVMTGAILAGTAAYPMVTESYVQDAADHGLKVNTWTVNDWDSMEYFAKIGVNAIIGNFPDLAEKALNPYR